MGSLESNWCSKQGKNTRHGGVSEQSDHAQPKICSREIDTASYIYLCWTLELSWKRRSRSRSSRSQYHPKEQTKRGVSESHRIANKQTFSRGRWWSVLRVSTRSRSGNLLRATPYSCHGSLRDTRRRQTKRTLSLPAAARQNVVRQITRTFSRRWKWSTFAVRTDTCCVRAIAPIYTSCRSLRRCPEDPRSY
jgi:hypothetical protein